MKKIFIFLILIFIIVLTGCNNVDNEITDDPLEDELFREIECREVSRFHDFHFSFNNSKNVVTLSFPYDWSFEKNNDGSYSIYRSTEKIGALIEGKATDLDNWKTVHSGKIDNEELYGERFVDKTGIGETLKFRHRFYFSYDENGLTNAFTITFDFKELASTVAQRKLTSALYRPIYTDPRMGALAVEAPSSILILGNSFINSSNVGGILDEMIYNNNKSCDVRAISRGYATVDTYVNDSGLMSEISSGKYDIVFICGFYSIDEIENLKTLKTYCDASNAKLVVFPAHNESIPAIEKAAALDGVGFINWKGEIDNFLINGKSNSDFCINDGHKHSTPLAGYVGAHMIYRAIYSEIPTGSISISIAQKNVAKLGSYVTTGKITNAEYDELIFVK